MSAIASAAGRVGARPRFDLAIIAASAGGLHALSAVLGSLNEDFPLPIVVVQHLAPGRASHLAQILGTRTRLPVKEAAHHDRLAPGAVYVAPPDFHAEFLDGAIELTHTPRLHFARPAADRSLISAAEQGPVIGVILSGAGVDGAAGVLAVKAAGGMVIAQDEATSEYFSMPHAAIDSGAVDLVLPLDQIGPTLTALARTIR